MKKKNGERKGGGRGYTLVVYKFVILLYNDEKTLRISEKISSRG